MLSMAISDNTRRTYAAPIAAYVAYCAARAIPPLPASASVLAEWLTSLAEAGHLRARTIGTYRSAISTYHAESAWGHLPGPTESPMIQRVMKGITVKLRAADAAARAALPPTTDLTPALLADIEATARGDTPASIMRWAAACTYTYGLFRSSELLGSPQHRERAITAAQVTFYMLADSDRRALLLPVGTDVTAYAAPDRFAIRLGATKTDAAGSAPPRVIAAPPAVNALWRWFHARRDEGAAGPLLFHARGESPLQMPQLLDYLELHRAAAGAGDGRLTGKTFRRGGASALVAGNVPRADAAAAGGWRSESMLEVYANQAAKNQRAIAVSRSMAPGADRSLASPRAAPPK